jgi:hypothetical protein
MVQRKEIVLCDAQKVNFPAPQGRASNRKPAENQRELSQIRVKPDKNGERAGYHKRIGNAAHVVCRKSEAGTFAASDCNKIQRM